MRCQCHRTAALVAIVAASLGIAPSVMAQEQQEPEDFCPEADGHLDCLVTRLAGPDAPAPIAEQQSLFPENGLTFTDCLRMWDSERINPSAIGRYHFRIIFAVDILHAASVLNADGGSYPNPTSNNVSITMRAANADHLGEVTLASDIRDCPGPSCHGPVCISINGSAQTVPIEIDPGTRADQDHRRPRVVIDMEGQSALKFDVPVWLEGLGLIRSSSAGILLSDGASGAAVRGCLVQHSADEAILIKPGAARVTVGGDEVRYPPTVILGNNDAVDGGSHLIVIQGPEVDITNAYVGVDSDGVTVVESPRMCVEIDTTAPNGRIGGQRIPVLIAGCTEAAIHTEAYNTSVGFSFVGITQRNSEDESGRVGEGVVSYAGAIEFKGNAAGSSISGTHENHTVISGSRGHGVLIAVANVTVNHCDVGIGVGNIGDGIHVQAPFARIGGDETGSVVVGNSGQSGIYVGTHGERAIIRNTFAGVSPDGSAALANALSGILIDAGAVDVILGLDPDRYPNDLIVASGNGEDGVQIRALNTVVGRFFAGAGLDGMTQLGNGQNGVQLITANTTLIRSPSNPSVVVGNGLRGLSIQQSDYVTISAEMHIGIGSDGCTRMPNFITGVDDTGASGGGGGVAVQNSNSVVLGAAGVDGVRLVVDQAVDDAVYWDNQSQGESNLTPAGTCFPTSAPSTLPPATGTPTTVALSSAPTSSTSSPSLAPIDECLLPCMQRPSFLARQSCLVVPPSRSTRCDNGTYYVFFLDPTALGSTSDCAHNCCSPNLVNLEDCATTSTPANPTNSPSESPSTSPSTSPSSASPTNSPTDSPTDSPTNPISIDTSAPTSTPANQNPAPQPVTPAPSSGSPTPSPSTSSRTTSEVMDPSVSSTSVPRSTDSDDSAGAAASSGALIGGIVTAVLVIVIAVLVLLVSIGAAYRCGIMNKNDRTQSQQTFNNPFYKEGHGFANTSSQDEAMMQARDGGKNGHIYINDGSANSGYRDVPRSRHDEAVC